MVHRVVLLCWAELVRDGGKECKVLAVIVFLVLLLAVVVGLLSPLVLAALFMRFLPFMAWARSNPERW